MKYSPINSDTLVITVDHGNDSALVRLQGRLGIDSSPDLRDRLLAILREQPPKSVIVDLSEVSYVDTSGVATLLEAFRFARYRHTRLQLDGLQGRLARLFEAIGLTALLEASDSTSAALTLKVP